MVNARDAIDDDDLVRRAQAGEVRAFEALVAGHLPRLRRFAKSFAWSSSDADDLAQEALIKIYRSLRSYRFESSFSTWMYRVTRNAFMDAWRHNASRERAADTAGDGWARDVHAPSPDDLLLQSEERERLWCAIRQVSPEFRSVLVLCDVEGMSGSEVAAIENLPEGTVKSRLHRGRAQLAQLLRKEAAEDERAAGNQPVVASVKPTEGMGTP
jgi:RNA polymerase sigma-70 factor (ECF subfamily)